MQVSAQPATGLHVQRLVDRLVAHPAIVVRGIAGLLGPQHVGDQLGRPAVVHPRLDPSTQLRVLELEGLGSPTRHHGLEVRHRRDVAAVRHRLRSTSRQMHRLVPPQPGADHRVAVASGARTRYPPLGQAQEPATHHRPEIPAGREPPTRAADGRDRSHSPCQTSTPPTGCRPGSRADLHAPRCSTTNPPGTPTPEPDPVASSSNKPHRNTLHEALQRPLNLRGRTVPKSPPPPAGPHPSGE